MPDRARPVPRLILASASPRRLDLLAQIGVVPADVRPADIDETPQPAERPRDYVTRMAREKARAVAADDALILAGDTVVAAGRRILPKTDTEAEARQCLTLLSGRRHRVLSAIALLQPDGTVRERMSETAVRFKRLSAHEIDGYIASEEWRGKAGGYAIQGRAAGLIDWIQGSYSGVVGLPLYETRILLEAAGYRIG